MAARSQPDFFVNDVLVQPQLNRITPRPATAHRADGCDSVQLEPKIMDVLLCLAERRGEVMAKDEIMESVWPDVVVSDDVLARAISELRNAFGDDPREPTLIETIRKRGYRLIADVEPVLSSDEASANSPLSAPANGRSEGDGGLADPARALAHPSPAAALWWAVAAIIALILFLLIVRPFRAEGDLPGEAVSVPVTSLPGEEISPSLSPDGRFVTFSRRADDGGSWDVYVKQVADGLPKRLTDDPADDGSPAWSPDGSRIAFIRRSDPESVGGGEESTACSIYVVPVLGGPERHVGACRDATYPDLAWSPDGSLLAFNDAAGGDRAHSIMLMAAESGETRRLTYPPESIWGDYDPAFSPDGSRIAFARALSEGLQELFVIPISGGDATRLFSGGRNLYGITWSADGRDVVFSSNIDGTYDLWSVPAEGGAPRPVVRGQQHLVNPSVSAGEGVLVYELRTYDVDLHRYDVQQSLDAGALIASTRWEMYPAFSPDGDRLAFVSDRSGSYELWISNADGSEPMRLTSFGGPLVSTPRWSPDGRMIAFDARPSGNADVFVLDAAGGRPVRVAGHESDDLAPFWSRDGRHLYFGSDRSGRWEIWQVDMPAFARGPLAEAVSGSLPEAVRITDGGAFTGRFLADDSTLFFVKHGERGIWRMPAGGGAATLLLPDLDPGDWGNWDVIGDDLFYVHRGDSVTVRRHDLRSGSASHVFTLPRITPTYDVGLAVSPDASSILYPSITRREADIMMVQPFPQDAN